MIAGNMICLFFFKHAICAHMNQHIMNDQNVIINIRQIVGNIKILYRTQFKERLKTLEVIIRQNKHPTLNKVSFTIGDSILKCIWYN